MKVNLTDFSQKELTFLTLLVEKELMDLTEKVKWMQENNTFVNDETLLPFYQARFDMAQLWYAQLCNAEVEVRMRETIKSN